jgi:Cu+-exporting ATPase
VTLVILAMGRHLFPGLFNGLPAAPLNWAEFALATPIVLWAGWPFFERGWQSIRTTNYNMFTLIAIGTGTAWVYSLVATLLPDAFPQGFRAADGSVAVYFEAAAVITVLVLLGQVLELRARAATGGAIRALLDLAPKTATRIRVQYGGTRTSIWRVHPPSCVVEYSVTTCGGVPQPHTRACCRLSMVRTMEASPAV